MPSVTNSSPVVNLLYSNVAGFRLLDCNEKVSVKRTRYRFAVHVLTVFVLSASPVTLFAQQAESDDTSFELDVMTFNIRALDPEVLGLQEALTAQIDFLQSEMPEYRWLGVDRGLNGGVGLSEATPIFYKHEVLVPIESGTFWLGDDPNPPTQRGRVARIVTWARFHHLETLRQFYVYNTHFTIRGGSRQIQSAELVIRSR